MTNIFVLIFVIGVIGFVFSVYGLYVIYEYADSYARLPFFIFTTIFYLFSIVFSIVCNFYYY